MKKKISVKIKNEEQILRKEYQAIFLEDKEIKYLEDKNTKVSFHLEKLLLKRENQDLKMEYDFKNKKGTIYLKEYKKFLEIIIDVKKIEQLMNQILIEYKIENNNFSYLIKWRPTMNSQ